MPGAPLSRPRTYGVAVLSVALAILTRLLLDATPAERMPFLPFLAAVVFTAWYGGAGPARITPRNKRRVPGQLSRRLYNFCFRRRVS